MREPEKLDHSEIDFVRRTILSAGKNPDDSEVFEEYVSAYSKFVEAVRAGGRFFRT